MSELLVLIENQHWIRGRLLENIAPENPIWAHFLKETQILALAEVDCAEYALSFCLWLEELQRNIRCMLTSVQTFRERFERLVQFPVRKKLLTQLYESILLVFTAEDDANRCSQQHCYWLRQWMTEYLRFYQQWLGGQEPQDCVPTQIPHPLPVVDHGSSEGRWIL